MPRLTNDDVIISAWNSLHNPTKDEAKKFLEIFEKLLTSK